jgi:hypothetical protein
MKVLLTLAFACLLAGCSKSNTKPQTSAESSDCKVFYVTTEGKVCFSEQAIWFQACAPQVYIKNGCQLHDGTIFIPETNPAEEIFQKCIEVKPLPADKASNYKKWLKDRVSEIQSITPGTTRMEANKILRQNGGLFTPSSITYSHKECDVLKVKIEFELAPDETEHKGFYLNENDKVKSVSIPYLGFYNTD